MTNLDLLLLKGPPHGDLNRGLNELRYTILTKGIPANSDGMSDLRIYIWLILLSAPPLTTSVYVDLVRQGASPAHAKIRNDTFRTLATDPLFKRRVTESSLVRVLNAVAWRIHDAHEARVNGWQSPPVLSGPPTLSNLSEGVGGGAGSPESRGRSSFGGRADEPEMSGYVQGMNVLAAPFLYAARSEVEAFAAFERFITVECPGYVRGSMEGVHRGLRLVDVVLETVDPRLAAYLLGKGLKAEIYAFASVLTMCACTPPLPEVLQLWDFLFAYGPHLNILCIVAQLILLRDKILDHPSPNSLLRSLPPLQAVKIIQIAISIAPKIPEHIYAEIVNHAK